MHAVLALPSAGDPVWTVLAFCTALAAACWLLSVLTGNYSQVDRLWSIAPCLYTAYFAARAGYADARLNLMAGLILLWGVRLTYNFARRGGYRWHGEDYRWAELRRLLGPVWFQVLNATFVAPYQNLLLFFITLPAYVAWRERGVPLNGLDGAAAIAFLCLLIGETVADQQQWNFQTAKRARQVRGKAVVPEFLASGLFRYSRHPNYFCELGMWWTVYLFSVAASGVRLNWSVVGAMLLTLLFGGSTWFTERLTREKYPAYADYQRTTPRLLPWPPARPGGTP